MRTRTLLLLAVTCGLAILLAGGIQLLRISNQQESTALHVGDEGRAGDAVVVVLGFEESAGMARVQVRLSGIDDPSGLAAFELVGTGAVKATADIDASTCLGFTLAAVECEVAFPAAALPSGDRQLVLRRADQVVRWVLR